MPYFSASLLMYGVAGRRRNIRMKPKVSRIFCPHSGCSTLITLPHCWNRGFIREVISSVWFYYYFTRKGGLIWTRISHFYHGSWPIFLASSDLVQKRWRYYFSSLFYKQLGNWVRAQTIGKLEAGQITHLFSLILILCVWWSVWQDAVFCVHKF